MTATPTIAIVIITYQRPEELNRTLENVLALDPSADEIIVLDNDPAQTGRQASSIDHPLITYIPSETNLGIAAGRNRAAQAAHSDLLVFLDDDAHFAEPTALLPIRDAFADPSLACLAFLIRNDESKKIVPKEFPGHRTAIWETPHPVSYFLGGAHALHRKVFDTLGGFDETFFYNGEELELSLRMLREGWTILYTPAVLVYHRAVRQGRQQTGQDMGVFWLIRNRCYLALKHLPLPYRAVYMSVWFGFTLLQALKKRCLGAFVRGLRALRAEGIAQRATAYRHAHPLPRAVIDYLRRHDGRLWY